MLKAPAGELHSVYKSLVCLVLQGAKYIIVGNQQKVLSFGQSAIVSVDMPVVGRIVQARSSEPYLTIAVKLDMVILLELAAHMRPLLPEYSAGCRR